MSRNGRVSVILPVYRGERYVAEAITSVLQQTYGELELIVVDDGSTDGSVSVVQGFLGDSRVSLVRQSNQGVAGARNSALHFASGEWVGFIDQDDVWETPKLERQLARAREYPSAALIHCDVSYIDGRGEEVDPGWGEWTTAEGHCFDRLFLANGIASATALVKRATLVELGGFDADRRLTGADEYDLWLRVAASHPIGRVRQKLVRYRLHESNASRNRVAMERALLGVLEKARRRYPELVRRIPPHKVRQRIGAVHLGLARGLAASRSWRRTYWHMAAALLYLRGEHGAWGELWRLAAPKKLRDRLSWYVRRVAGGS